jgi:hypothetical protein
MKGNFCRRTVNRILWCSLKLTGEIITNVEAASEAFYFLKMNSRPFVARYNPMPSARRSGSFVPAAIVRPLMAPRPPVVRYATQPPLVRQ